MKIPKDLGVKIGTKLEALWTDVKKQCETEIEVLEKSLIVQKAFLILAKQKIKDEQEGGKSLNTAQ